MHKNTKIPPALRKEIYAKWQTDAFSLRELGALYHVDKRVIQRIIARASEGDFSLHESVNKRYAKPSGVGPTKRPGAKSSRRSPPRPSRPRT